MAAASPGLRASPAARRAGIDTWLAGLAGDTVILLNTQDNEAEHTAETRAVCQLPEDNRTGKQSGRLVHPHTTLRGAGAGPDAVRRRVIQMAAGRDGPVSK